MSRLIDLLKFKKFFEDNYQPCKTQNLDNAISYSRSSKAKIYSSQTSKRSFTINSNYDNNTSRPSTQKSNFPKVFYENSENTLFTPEDVLTKDFDFLNLYNPSIGSDLINKRINQLQDDGKSIKEIMADSFISKSTLSRLRTEFDEAKKHDKETLVKLAIGIELNLAETHELLKSFGLTLSRTSAFDVAAVYFFSTWKFKKNHRGSSKGLQYLQLLLDKTNQHYDVMKA